jgi:hypothetical protein
VIRDSGTLEAHDHGGVNTGLKHAADVTGVSMTPGLNAEFSARLAKLKAVPAGHERQNEQRSLYTDCDIDLEHAEVVTGLVAKEAKFADEAF